VATTTTVDGTKLYWEESGSGDPLLLIQGLGWSAAMWRQVLPAFEERYRVIRYDARGVGRSDVPEGPYPIALMAEDATVILDAAGVERAHVFGCSLGGIVAQEVALTYGDRVTSLVLCSRHDGASPEEAMRASIPYAYAPGTDPEIIEADIRLRLEIPTSAPGYFGQLMGGLGYPGTADRLPSLSMPALVITGDGDQLVPAANSDTLADLIPNARKVIVQGAGHVVFNERPDEVTRATLEFLEGVPAAR
jgi:3-oxoadipate enol-lactonase